MIASRLVVVTIAAIAFTTAAVGQGSVPPVDLPLWKLRDCDSVPEHSYFTPSAGEEERYDVDYILNFGDLGYFVAVKGCGVNSDFIEFFVSGSNWEALDFFAIPLFDSGADDFLIKLGDAEFEAFAVYDAGSDYEYVFRFMSAPGIRIADVDQDGRYDFVAQWILEFECANGVVPQLVFHQEAEQVISPHSVCAEGGTLPEGTEPQRGGGGAGKPHGGVDFIGEVGDPVAASLGGTAYRAVIPGYGNVVVLQHPNGYFTLHAHLDTIDISNHQQVQQGEQIGTLGTSGNADEHAPHLHFEVWIGGITIDDNGTITLPGPGAPRIPYRIDPEVWLGPR